MIIVIILLAILDRLREIFDWRQWFNNSVFTKIENEKVLIWFREKGIKAKPFGKFTHPIFYNGYHCAKNLGWLTLIIYHIYTSGDWIYLIIDSILIYIIQKYLQPKEK